MDDDHLPEPQPAGALVPPPNVPPLALATAAPLPPRPRRDSSPSELRSALRRLVETALDELDMIGDRVAGVVGLRGR